MQPKPQYQEPTYSAPYTGVDNSAPEYLIPVSATPFMENFEFRNKELRTVPRFKIVIPHPVGDSALQGLTTFLDSNNVVHTVGITSNNLWQLIYRAQIASGQRWVWNKVGNFNTNGSDEQYSTQVFLDKLYFTNGSGGVFSWDGITNNASEITGSLYSSKYLLELGFHLILFNTLENVAGVGTLFPQRVRWSPSGLPTVWNPAVNSAAGFNDMIDVPDAITGALAVGQRIFIFRTNGITQMSLTGNAAKPFQFDHMWASDRGIGNAFSQSIAGYGPVGIFISTEDIYKVSPNNFETIGGGARDAIMLDLYNATSPAIATIIPGLHATHIYITYRLCIPMGNNCVMWTYSIEDKNWMRRVLKVGVPTTKMRNCAVK